MSMGINQRLGLSLKGESGQSRPQARDPAPLQSAVARDSGAQTLTWKKGNYCFAGATGGSQSSEMMVQYLMI